MDQQSKEESVLNHIQELVEREHELFKKHDLESEDREQLKRIEVELDQCWDLLRQRRALREANEDPEKAHVRPPEVVEKYEQ